MSRILNPFEYLSVGKALGWGLAGTVLCVVLVCIARWPVEWSFTEVMSILSTNLVLWLLMASLLYVSALVFSPSRIRALDIFATNLFALLPVIVVYGISSVLFGWIRGFNPEPKSIAWLAVSGFYYLMLLVSSISLVWSMVWGCMAFRVSANIKNGSGVAIFLVCFVIVNLAIQLVISYFSL
ncbi:hypothetical protein [Alistipes sp.]|uniref:hypothetical protein n=1 Tax=Alistipes sp. TaxID=1872444 RepID=UPI003AEFCB4B